MLRDHIVKKGGLALAACAALAIGSPARADQALVVGVNQYPGLDGVNLKGCVNDAQSVATALQTKYHFNVTMLSDATAKKQGIINALNRIAGTIKPSEKFVFYFAGHGTIGSNGKSVLLPSDADENSEANDFGADLLNQKIKAIPAKSRTVLLDSCFSGGMMRSAKGLRGHPHMLTRGYVRPNKRSARGGSKDLTVVNLADTNESLGGTSGSVCYFTATRENEQAGEDEFEGQRHGVFTYFLVPKLDGARDIWQDIKNGVASNVSDHMDDTQHPTLSPTYDSVVAFDGKAGGSDTPDTPDTPPAPNTPDTPDTPTTNDDSNKPRHYSGTKSVWDLYNADHVNHAKVSLTMFPNQTTIAVNDQISFHVASGESGYLIVLERGTSGSVNLIYPLDASIDSSHVSGDTMTDFPSDGKAFAADTAGNERIKAILFEDKNQAADLLKNFGQKRSLNRNQMKKMQSRDLKIVSATDTPQFYTSDITFEVTQ